MTTEELTALNDALAKMTPDWVVEADFVGTFYINDDESTIADALTYDDAAGIVALVNAAPALIASVARAAELEAEVARLRAILVEAEVEFEELGAVTVPKRIRAALGEQQ